jgi:hypothetical protein
MALALASALPSRCSLSTCTRRCDSPCVPLLKFNSPSRFMPETHVPRLSAQDSSLRFVPLQRFRMRESTSPPGKPPTSPKTRKQPISWSNFTQSEDQIKPTGGSQTACFGAAPRLSQPLSDLVPLTTALPFSGSKRSWGCTLQGLSPFAKPPATRRCWNPLLSFLHPVALSWS